MAIKLYDYKFVWHKSGGHAVIFEAANQDLTDSTYQYFGYISSSGSWMVQRFEIIASAIIYTYFAGQTRTVYDALWDANGIYTGSLTFVTFDQLDASL